MMTTKHIKGMTQEHANNVTALLAGYADYQDIPIKEAMNKYFESIVQGEAIGELQQYIGPEVKNI